jgi:hypothetical protein
MDTTTIDLKLLNDPAFQRVLAIQDRFAAEPVYATTDKGHLKSAGVEELKQIKVLAKHGSHLAPRDEPSAIAGTKGFRTF